MRFWATNQRATRGFFTGIEEPSEKGRKGLLTLKGRKGEVRENPRPHRTGKRRGVKKGITKA